MLRSAMRSGAQMCKRVSGLASRRSYQMGGGAKYLKNEGAAGLKGLRFSPKALAIGAGCSLAAVGLSCKMLAEACGIVGYVGSENAVDYLLEGIHILQNRGYDSAGVATLDNDDEKITVTKFASLGTTSDSVEKLQKEAPSRHKGHKSGTSSVGAYVFNKVCFGGGWVG
eukprot:jgi/Bigna1/141245/aug1.61_g15953